MALFGETSCCLLNQSAEELFDYSLPLLFSLEFLVRLCFLFSFLLWANYRRLALNIRRTLDLVVDSDGHHYNNKMVISFVFAFSRLCPSGTNQKFGFVGGKKEEAFVSRHSS